jgi:hypothetical protein
VTQDSRGKILLVDDDDLVLSALSLSLDDAGFAVVTASNGALAVERVVSAPSSPVGERLAVPPTSKEIPDHGIAIFQVTDGKIVKTWAEWNQLEVAQQLGVGPFSLGPTDYPLLHEPGSRWTYSMSTRVLGELVEELSGQPLQDFFQG